MVTRNCIYGAVGTISRILSKDKAEITFQPEENVEYAFLTKDAFYYNGRKIPENESLISYINYNSEVKFSCTVLKKSDTHRFSWMVNICWILNQSPGASVDVSIGMEYVLGEVSLIENNYGVLILSNRNGKDQNKVFFTSSKFYINGIRVPTCKPLSSELKIGDLVFCDAVPCIPEITELRCKWIATCTFKGKRPDIYQKEANNNNKKIIKDHHDLLAITRPFSNNPKNMFISGRGLIFEILPEGFGLILAEFQYNNFQKILFHREHTYLFKMCIKDFQLPEILVEGDRVKFVAVGAPSNFLTDWIAVQVSICDSKEYGKPKFYELPSINDIINSSQD